MDGCNFIWLSSTPSTIVLANTESMWSMAGMMVATHALSVEKNNVASLKISGNVSQWNWPLINGIP